MQQQTVNPVGRERSNRKAFFRIFLHASLLVFLMLAAKGGTAVETFMAVICAILWAAQPETPPTISGERTSNFNQEPLSLVRRVEDAHDYLEKGEIETLISKGVKFLIVENEQQKPSRPSGKPGSLQ